MANNTENIAEIIARLKQQKEEQKIRASAPISPKPIEQEEDEIDFEGNNLEEEELAEKKFETERKKSILPIESKVEQINEENSELINKQEQIMNEIEKLNNNGVYRTELLFQLQEITKCLEVIAGVLVDMNGKKN